MGERKRARSVRRVDKQELEFAKGGHVDDSIPESEIDKILARFSVQADWEAFKAFLRYRVGAYRSLTQSAQSEPTTAQEIKLIDEILGLAEELRTRIEGFPPKAEAESDYRAWKLRGEHFHDQKNRLDNELESFSTLVSLTRQDLEQSRGKDRGAKPKTDRDWFLSDVSQRLTDNDASVDAARSFEITHELCVALRVEVPEYTYNAPSELGDIIRAWRNRTPDK